MERKWTIPPQNELCLETKQDSATGTTTLCLQSGTAEIFGSELALKRKYKLPANANLAVYSFEGAEIVLGGCELDVEYLSDVSCQHMLANTAIAIQDACRSDSLDGSNNYKVLVLGDGRTTATQSLLNYCQKSGEFRVWWVDLDYERGVSLVPGAICAQAINSGSMSVEEACFESSGMPLAFFVGEDGVGMDGCVPPLASSLAERIQKSCNKTITTSADNITIINAPRTTDTSTTLPAILSAFAPALIIVVGNERLAIQASKVTKTKILKLPRSSGLVTLSPTARSTAKNALYQRYFYGSPLQPQTPFTLYLPMDQVSIYSINASSQAPSSALPLGHSAGGGEGGRVGAVPVDPTAATLLYSILAVSWGDGDQQDGDNGNANESLLARNIAGFVYVKRVDEVKRTLEVLSTCPGKLPTNTLLMSTIKWIEPQ